MARLWSCGFELQSVTALVEFDTVANTPTIDTTTKRSGAAALRCNVTATTANIRHQVYAAEGTTNDIFVRFYLYITTATDALDTIFRAENTTNGASIDIRMNSNRTLELWRAAATAAQIGSDSAALNTGQWYRIELGITTDGSGNVTSVEGKIDGTAWASGWSGAGLQAPHLYRFGVISASTADLYYDDIAINDSSGSNQTTYPGEGSIVHMYPNADGDNHGWLRDNGSAGDASNYTEVDETTPDDATSYVKRTSGQPIDDYNLQTAASAGIAAIDSITLVEVGARVGAISNTASSDRELTLRIKGQASGSVQSVSNIDISINGWRTHSDPLPRIPALTAYVNPQDSAAWAPSDLDQMQIGIQPDTSSTVEVRVSTMWALVEYIPGTAFAVDVFEAISITENVNMTLIHNVKLDQEVQGVKIRSY